MDLRRCNEAQARQFTASLLGISLDPAVHWFKDPEQRMRHDQIRAHRLLAPLGLPQFTAERKEATQFSARHWYGLRRIIMDFCHPILLIFDMTIIYYCCRICLLICVKN